VIVANTFSQGESGASEAELLERGNVNIPDATIVFDAFLKL